MACNVTVDRKFEVFVVGILMASCSDWPEGMTTRGHSLRNSKIAKLPSDSTLETLLGLMLSHGKEVFKVVPCCLVDCSPSPAGDNTKGPVASVRRWACHLFASRVVGSGLTRTQSSFLILGSQLARLETAGPLSSSVHRTCKI